MQFAGILFQATGSVSCQRGQTRKVLNLSKLHGISRVCMLLEQDLCPEMLLKSPQMSVERDRSITLKATVLKKDE